MPDLGDRPTLLVFADDWGRHPSSCQHLIRQLLGRYEVYWVNTIGMRTPGLNIDTVRRAAGKIRQWIRKKPASNHLPEYLHVANPRMWPWFTSTIDRWLNTKLLGRHVRGLIATMPEKPIAITTIPIVSELMGTLPVRKWVYYCVDDFSTWPGLDQKTLAVLEGRLVHNADVLIAVSENLQDRLRLMGRQSFLLSHGVDLDYWNNLENSDLPEIAHLERPIVAFWGLIDRRMDTQFVATLAREMRQGTIVLVGPHADPDPAILQLPRVVAPGAWPMEKLRALAWHASVLVMPYADLPVTRAMQPLKLKEYLATGKPAVVRNLPAVREWSDTLDAADTAGEFSAAVQKRLESGLPETQRQTRERLTNESWKAKAELFEAWALGQQKYASVHAER